MPSLSALLNSSSTFVFFNNLASFSYLHLCSLLCASFSLANLYSFSMALSALMLLWTAKLWKDAQLPTTNANYFQQLPCFFSSLNIPPIAFNFLPTHRLLINVWSSKLIQPIITSICVPYIATWKHFTSSLWMNATNFIFQLLHIINIPSLVLLDSTSCTLYTFCWLCPFICWLC
jgi:hypothetical protein